MPIPKAGFPVLVVCLRVVAGMSIALVCFSGEREGAGAFCVGVLWLRTVEVFVWEAIVVLGG